MLEPEGDDTWLRGGERGLASLVTPEDQRAASVDGTTRSRERETGEPREDGDVAVC